MSVLRLMTTAMSKTHRIAKLATTILVLFLATAPSAAREIYQTSLGPSPMDDATRTAMRGRGMAVATLEGNNLVVSGDFAGLGSPAMQVQLRSSVATGVPGPSVYDLQSNADGTISGTLTLADDQLAALRGGRLYVQVNSRAFPEPYGNLWGWLMPERKIVGDGVVERDHWFLPQLDLPKSR